MDLCFLHMFLRERFSTVAFKPMEFLAVKMEEAVFPDYWRGMRPFNTYNPQAWRWLNAKQASNKSLVKVIDKEDASASDCMPTLLRELRRLNSLEK